MTNTICRLYGNHKNHLLIVFTILLTLTLTVHEAKSADISPVGAVNEQSIQVDPNGDIIATWNNGGVIQSAIKKNQSTLFAQPVDISPVWLSSTSSSPNLIIDPDGKSTIIWMRSSGWIQSADKQLSDNSFGSFNNLFQINAQATQFRATLIKNNTILLTWVLDGVLFMSEKNAGDNSFSVPQEYSGVNLSQYRISDDGDIAAAWIDNDDIKVTIKKNQDNQFSSPVTVSSNQCQEACINDRSVNSSPIIQFTKDGSLITTWSNSETSQMTGYTTTRQEVSIQNDRSTSFTIPQTIYSQSNEANPIKNISIKISLEPNGGAWIYWYEPGVIKTSRRMSGETSFGAVSALYQSDNIKYIHANNIVISTSSSGKQYLGWINRNEQIMIMNRPSLSQPFEDTPKQFGSVLPGPEKGLMANPQYGDQFSRQLQIGINGNQPIVSWRGYFGGGIDIEKSSAAIDVSLAPMKTITLQAQDSSGNSARVQIVADGPGEYADTDRSFNLGFGYEYTNACFTFPVCKIYVDSGTPLTISQTRDHDSNDNKKYDFLGWEGACSTIANGSCIVTVDDNKSITAKYKLIDENNQSPNPDTNPQPNPDNPQPNPDEKKENKPQPAPGQVAVLNKQFKLVKRNVLLYTKCISPDGAKCSATITITAIKKSSTKKVELSSNQSVKTLITLPRSIITKIKKKKGLKAVMRIQQNGKSYQKIITLVK